MRRREVAGRLGAGVLVALSLALPAGCALTPSPGAPSPTTAAGTVPPPDAAGPGGTAAPETPQPPEPPVTAQDVRTTGVPVSADEWTFWLFADALEVEAGIDGSQVLTATAEPGADVTALLAGPEGSRFEVLDDGSAVVLDPAGIPVAGLTTPAEIAWSGPAVRFEVRAPDLLVLTTAPVASATAAPVPEQTPNRVMTVLGSASALTAVWGEAEGGRSLAVTPTGWVRGGGGAAEAVGWAAVLRAAPDAGTEGMQDQFACHVLGAANKTTWNLEPWRPAAGYLATLVARCNP